MDFNLGGWVVEALNVIESSTHLKLIAYGLTLAVIMRAVARFLLALKKENSNEYPNRQ